MTCGDVAHLVEAIVAGDLQVAPEVRAHLESCPPCAAALASARRIDAARMEAEPPAHFASAVIARVRRERWTTEQRVDRVFNLALVFALLAVAASIGALAGTSGLSAAGEWAWRAGASLSAQLARQAAPVLAAYVAAAGVLLSALFMWWWAERRRSL